MKSRTSMKRRALALALALTAGVVVAPATPASAQVDLNASERQRLWYSIKPATVRIAYRIQAAIDVPGEERSVELRTSVMGGGSGWVLTPDGFIVTNGHVVELFHEANEDYVKRGLLAKALDEAGHFAQVARDRERTLTDADVDEIIEAMYPNSGFEVVSELRVFLQNDDSYAAEIRSFSPPVTAIPGKVSVSYGASGSSRTSGRDVAILKVPARDLPTLRLGTSDDARIGEEIFAAGFPGSLEDHMALDNSMLSASISRGTVSALRVAVEGSNLIQFDAPVTYGNSGGPVVDGQGRVLGIATMISTDGRGQQTSGFSFAVPASTIRQFVPAAVDLSSQSLFNTTWERALDDYYAGNYSSAVSSFDEVLRVMPDLPDAELLRRNSITQREAGSSTPPVAPESGVAPVATETTSPEPVSMPSSGGVPGWLLPLLIAGVALVGAGLYMRRSTAPAVAPAGPSPSSGGGASASAPTIAVQAVQASQLVASAGPLKGNAFDIGPEGLKIGRDPAVCQIVLSDANVSREHAVIRPNGSSLMIKNLSGTNPTYVNDRAIQESSLQSGDKVKVGESIFVLEAS